MRWHMGLLVVLVSSTIPLAHSQAPAGAHPPTRAPLFFKEEWKQPPQGGEHPAGADSLGNASLELKQYVPSGQILMSGSAENESNPTHVWTGLCTSPCAVAFRDKNRLADLSGLARIRWNTKMSGLHQVRPIVKLADGTWLVGDRGTGSVVDWHEDEFSISDIRWLRLDIDKVLTKGNFVEKADLSKVDEIGFADLMPGSGHGPGGWADVGMIEVYGKPVKR